MQAAGPEAVDLTKETEATKKLYGMDDEATAKFGTNCLLARRLVERGVRFVELYCGSGSGWDAHNNIEGNHSKMCQVFRQADRRPAHGSEGARAAGRHAGRLGRRIRPHAVQRKGRRPRSQSLGLHHVDGRRRHQGRAGDRHHRRDRPARHRQAGARHDIHATILHALGLNHMDVTFLHNGRSERPTIVTGEVIHEAFA